MSFSSSLLLSLNCLIVPSSLSDIVLIFLPNSLISSLESLIRYFLEKSSLDIFFVMSFNSKIGSVNLREMIETASAAMIIVKSPINIKTLFEILTLSSIGATGIRINKL